MNSTVRYVVVAALTAAAWLGPVASPSNAQPPLRVDGIYPRQLPRGETTSVSLAIPVMDAIESADISPAAGLTVSGLTRGENFQGNNTWWTLMIAVGSDAAPGARTLNLHLPAGRTVSTGLVIPTHTPRISDLRLTPVKADPPALDLEFSAVDASNDLGDKPYVWFLIECTDPLLPGVVRGSVTRQGDRAMVRARIPRLLPGETLAPDIKTCDLQVRASDSGGMDSNTLATSFDVTN